MASEKTPVVWDDDAKKHRPLGSGEKMGGLSASSMISSDTGNLLQQGSDGLMLVTGGSIADPRADNLLEESANGKLQVTSDRVVEWLEGHPQAAAAIAEAVKVVSGDDGNVITSGTDKGAFMSKNALAGAVSTMSAAQLSTLANALRKQGGGLSVGSDGKLSVDFGSMDPAIMRNVVLSMVQQGGGIAVDQSGKLYVDFDNMPTDKFNAMLKSLKMQIPLEANLDLYVDDDSDGDSIVDGRGTQAKPFKTIQACINYATQTYALGSYRVAIFVAPGTYVGALTLPDFTRTTGSFVIKGQNANSHPLIACNAVRYAFTCKGGTWYLEDLDISCHFPTPSDSLNHSSGCVLVSGAGSYVGISGCSMSAVYDGATAAGNLSIRALGSFNGGTLVLNTRYGVHNSISVGKGNANNATVLHSENSGYIAIPSGEHTDSGNDYTITCTGTADSFAVCTLESRIYVGVGGQHYQHFTGDITVTRQYSISNGSSVLAPSDGFPGDSASNVLDSSTYCWYKTAGS